MRKLVVVALVVVCAALAGCAYFDRFAEAVANGDCETPAYLRTPPPTYQPMNQPVRQRQPRKCPLCDGSGQTGPYGGSNGVRIDCFNCHGTGIVIE
jgi:hypothetical protein